MVTVTCVAPSPAPVSWPVALTATTPALPELHASGTPAITAPAAVRTVAVSARVPPGASTAAVGATTTELAAAPGPV